MSSRRESHNVYATSDPDRQRLDNRITSELAPMHGIVLEFAWPQDCNRLPELGEFYLWESELDAKLVIATSAATGKLMEHAQELRTDDGRRVPGPPLQILMSGIAPPHCVSPYLPGKDIEFSVDELCKGTEAAERMDRLWRAKFRREAPPTQ
ncbi:hypothetical protein AYL99_11162 [Fonsecaea erecta]|uniref:Uncharacterized protein n=1 Tax=Fonsecaea erecta TaxID=1367422 RepID=A0A178Z4P1_9EURO|nr:hypothetical protein AYL99_11162 [Fonsecaea erecta]OAP54714.1 hypothetical protein AYL99_11162 [Fonsecaea erecta]